PFLLTLYYLSWICLLRPQAAWDRTTRNQPLVRLFRRLRVAYWPRPRTAARKISIPTPVVALMSTGWFQAVLRIECLTMGALNLFILMIIHVLCGFWVALLSRKVRTHPLRSTIIASTFTFMIMIGHYRLAHSSYNLLYPSSQAVFGLVVLPVF